MIVNRLIEVFNQNQHLHLSRLMRKPALCENKNAGQLCRNRTADQSLCFRGIDRTIYKIYRLYISAFVFAAQIELLLLI